MIEQSPLLTDLYELSMLEAYAAYGMAETAAFELFVRKLPDERGFLVAAGLEQAVGFLETMRFTPDDLAWLHASRMFSPAFVESLAGLRFTGDVDAMAEGTRKPCGGWSRVVSRWKSAREFAGWRLRWTGQQCRVSRRD
jgi:nicotinate phosphoribosyltransferase